MQQWLATWFWLERPMIMVLNQQPSDGATQQPLTWMYSWDLR